MTANVLPLRFRIAPRHTLGGVVQQTSQVVRAALRHQRYRYEDMLRDLKVVDGAPLFDLSVNIMGFEYPQRFGPCTATARTLWSGPTHDRRINVYDRPGSAELVIEAEVNDDLHDEPAATDIARHYLRVLRSFTELAPGDPLSSLSLLSDEERRRVLTGWNATACRTTAGSLVEEFEQQVAAAPGAPAVVGDRVELSYAELDARANRLAGHLRGLGAGAESVVAIVLERGVDLIVAVLGVLKSGAAYLPIDPRYPAERITFTIARQRRVAAAHLLRRTRQRRALPAPGRPGGAGRCGEPAAGPAAGEPVAGRPGLRDLHVGLDRNAEGRRPHPRRRGEPRHDGPATLRRRPRRPGAAVRVRRLRRGDVRAGVRAVHRCGAGGRGRRRAAARRRARRGDRPAPGHLRGTATRRAGHAGRRRPGPGHHARVGR